MTQHIGYAGRTAERLRYDGDPREVRLEISAEAASDMIDAIDLHPDRFDRPSPLHQLRMVLGDMMHR